MLTYFAENEINNISRLYNIPDQMRNIKML